MGLTRAHESHCSSAQERLEGETSRVVDKVRPVGVAVAAAALSDTDRCEAARGVDSWLRQCVED